MNIYINIRENVHMFDCKKMYVQREVTPHITIHKQVRFIYEMVLYTHPLCHDCKQ